MNVKEKKDTYLKLQPCSLPLILKQGKLAWEAESEYDLMSEGFSSSLFHAVVDVYAEWCGPCKAVVSLFRRVKNELGDDLLRFATVCVLKPPPLHTCAPFPPHIRASPSTHGTQTSLTMHIHTHTRHAVYLPAWITIIYTGNNCYINRKSLIGLIDVQADR